MADDVCRKGNIIWSGTYRNVLTMPRQIATWEEQIRLILNEIERTQCGRLLIGDIHKNGHRMLIVPDPGTDINAATYSTNARGAFPRGQFSDSTGSGCSTIIELTPSNYSVRSGVFSAADTALFHEMCHGLHDMCGRSQANLTLGGDFDTLDEFWAITLTNIYVSERHYPGLRADHHGRTQLEPRLCDSEAFYNWATEAVGLVCQSAPEFTRGIARVPASFNPIKVYWDARTSRH